jgi:outer membrane protein OmpA-like peptidoglycan-associated protein
MGTGINTEKDEFTPFIHANNTTLFFASNGHPGMGGLDLFYCNKTRMGFTPPLNLGSPVNSHLQETGLVISPNGKSAFFNEEVRGKKDSKSVRIKTFPIPSDWKINPATTYVKGRVYDAETKQSISAQIQVVDLAENNSTYKVKSDPFSGKYLAVINAGKTYGLFVAEPGYLYKSLTFDVEKEDSLKPKEVDIPLVKVKKGSRTTMTNLYFDTNKWNLKSESIAEMEILYQFMEINASIAITVEGHTDDVGPDADNLVLSQKRAQSVKDYLTEKGISANRIKTIGYGETKPINKAGGALQVNRRIEFVIN